MTNLRRSVALCCALLFPMLGLRAEEIRDYYSEPGLNPFKDSLNQHFNEHVDPFSGTLQLKYTDLTIPGNGGMDIKVTRVYTSIQTNQMPIVGLNGLGWTMHFGRIVVPQQHANKICIQQGYPLTTKENPSLELSDGGRELLVLNHIDNDGTLITRSNWRARCLEAGDGMLVTSPDGTRYTMNQRANFDGQPSWYTTRIEDLHGNWIRVEYAVNAVGITYINAVYRSEEGSSSPVVRYEYENEDGVDIRLESITANGQTVRYRYETIPGFIFPYFSQLVEVERPDNHNWEYEYHPQLTDTDPDDGVMEPDPGSYSLIHVKYPFGATIDYTYQYVQFDPGSMERTTSIRRKEVSGSDVTGGNWTYTFAPHSSTIESSGGLRYDVTLVRGPDDVQKFYHYGKDFSFDVTDGYRYVRPALVGSLGKKEVLSTSGTLLERTAYSWSVRAVSAEDFWHGAGYRNWWRDNGTYAPVLIGEYMNRDSRADQSTYLHYKQYFDYDAYGNPGRIYESTNLQSRPARQTIFTYRNDIPRWVLGLVTHETHQDIVNGGPQTEGETERTYTDEGDLESQTVLGIRTQYTYTNDGDLATVQDARGKIRRYSNYKRGVARREELPESVTITRDVNDSGTVSSETNGRGYTTSFDYDDLNRLRSINFPVKADVSIFYGSGTRTLTRSNYRQVEYINDFGQITRVERRDTLTNQTIYRTNAYDASGRQIFNSYPNSTAGITSTFDELGRVTRTQHPDGTGVDYAYDAAEVVVTNERRFATTYRYGVSGVNFSGKSLSFIASPEGVGTIIRKNTFDNTTEVFQGELLSSTTVRGYGKTYDYNAHQFLVSSIEPEVGTTVFTHDEVGNVRTEQVNDNEVVTFHYDDLNRRERTDFSGDTPDVVVTYDRNGNIEDLFRGSSQWHYVYDPNDNLLSETLEISDTLLGAKTFATGYAHSDLDVISQITYPSGLVVDYAPDAFGRATKAGTFASAITYHPSGQLQSYRLANGVTTNVALNARLLTQRISAGSLVDLQYTYDPVGNVTSIADGVDASKSVNMTNPGSYDGLDRLLLANGPWGTARFSYDVYGNIRTKVVGDDSLTNYVDAQRRPSLARKFSFGDPNVIDTSIHSGFDSRGNMTTKRKYSLATIAVALDRQDFVYDASSNLVRAKVSGGTSQASVAGVDKHYAYDGNGQRFLEKKHRSYDIRFSVHSRAGQLLFEDSIADCTRTDYVRLGALTIARSDDQSVVPSLDTDGDAIKDCLELQLGLNPNDAADANADRDGDGLANRLELLAGSSIFARDTDGDGLTDLQEANQYLTDPTTTDSDGDGLLDGVEAGDARVDPVLADRDHDGVSDYWELQLGTDPHNPSDGRLDTDGDGFSNRQEGLVGFDPTNATKIPTRGRQGWALDTLGRIYSSAALARDGTIYVTAENKLFAVNADGTVKWEYAVPGTTLSTPTASPDGTVYVVATVLQSSFQENDPRAFVHAINANGTRKWLYTSIPEIDDSVVLGADNRIYFSYTRFSFGWSGMDTWGGWTALDQNGRAIAGGLNGDFATRAPVVAATGNVYAVDDYGLMRGYSPEGAMLWEEAMQGAPGQSPIISGDRVYFVSRAGVIYAMSLDGELRWTRQLSGGESRSTVTVGVDGTLYLGAYDSKLYAINPQDGSDFWIADTYGTSYTPAIGKDGTIYVTTWGGSVTAFSPAGAQLWRHDIDIPVSAPPVIDTDGMLYFGSRAGQLVAVIDNSGGLARTPWPMARHDSAGTSYVCFTNDAFSTTADIDGDGIDDCSELRYGLNPHNAADANLDPDGDGLTNAQEHALGTSLTNADTDGDGLNDRVEFQTYQTNPRVADTDGDSINDGKEIEFSLNPLDAADAMIDSDNDGFSNRQENWAGSDLRNASSVPAPGYLARSESNNNFSQKLVAVGRDGTIYQNSSNGLEALNPNLTVKWNWSTPIVGAPVIGPDGAIHVVTARANNQQKLVALLPNGAVRWSATFQTLSTSTGLFDSPAVAPNGNVYVVETTSDSYGDYLHAFTSEGLRPAEWPYGQQVFARRPKISVDAQNRVIVYDPVNALTLRRPNNGTELWRYSLTSSSYADSSPVVGPDGTIYVRNGGSLHAINPATGTRRWLANNVNGWPLISADNRIIAYCGYQRDLCAIDPATGTTLWTDTNDYTFNGAPTLDANGSILVLTNNNLFVAFNPDGSIRWQTPLANSYSAYYPVVLNDGTIYVGAYGHRLLLIGDGRGLANSPWPARDRDHKNSRHASGIPNEEPNPAPSLLITTPELASIRVDVGQSVSATAVAADFADGDLNAAIRWTSSLDGAIGQGPSISLSALSIGTHTVTATVTDSSGLTKSQTRTVEVGVFPPELYIQSPIDNLTFDEGEAITFMARATDVMDGDISANVRWTSDRDGQIGIGSRFTVSNLSLGAHRITATSVDSTNVTSTAVVNVTVRVLPPTIGIYQPSDSQEFEAGVPVTFGVNAYDSIDGDLADSVRWSSNLEGDLGTGRTISTANLRLGTHVVTATVSDSGGAVATDTVSIVVRRLPPTLSVYSPSGYTTVQQGDDVEFNASASDPIDGDLTSAIQWSSSLDGPLGTGSGFVRADLSVGTHVVTVSVTDSSGEFSSRQRYVVVQSSSNTAPYVSISAPVAGGDAVYHTDPVTMIASGYDTQDGVISSAIQWSSNLEGTLGTGASVTTTALRIGTHTLRAFVTDSGGAKAVATVQLTINPIPANYPPVVKITSLGVGGFYTANSTIPFTGTAADREHGDLASSIVWSSNIDGQLGRGAAVYATLSAGEHIITAQVTDPGGAVGTRTKTITVNADGEAQHVYDTFSVASGPNLLAGWQIVEDGTLLWPSAWYVSSGEAVEFAGTYRGSTTASVIDKPGTYLLQTTGSHWTDYRVNVNLRSPDNDGIGLMFRVQDNNNYYRFSMDSERNFRRLVKKVNGTFTQIWQGTGTYVANQNYQLEVTVQGTTITISLDGVQLYSGTDTSLRRGTIGLYSWNNQGSAFDNVEVANLTGPSANYEPVVSITSPADNTSVVSGTLVTFTGNATDVEDGSLSSTISWSSDRDGNLGTGGTLSTSTLSIGTHTITATSRDSRNASSTATIRLTVNERVNTPPAVNITAPASGLSFSLGANITFTGTATDAEDGTISNGIVWSSNLDGSLGTGASIAVNWLRSGTHTITATITDSEQGTTTRTTTLTVTQFVNQAPVVTITAPASGGTYTSGALIAFTATATDAEDGNLASLITWASDRDGALGSTGSISTSTLSVGVHTITATVRDSTNATHSRSITLTIGAAPPTLMSDNFSDNNFNGWTVVTEPGTTSGPAAWSASTGALRQTSSVYGGTSTYTSSNVSRPGTYIHFGAGSSWTNYTLEADLRSTDADAFGLLFRYQNSNNYYRFSMDRQFSQRRLVKKVGGTYTVLRQDSVQFNTSQTYRVSVTVNGSAITVLIDGVQFYSGTDTSLSSGSVAMYTYRNSGATFDNVVVRGVAPTASTNEPRNSLEDSRPLFTRTPDEFRRERLSFLFPPLLSGGGLGQGQPIDVDNLPRVDLTQRSVTPDIQALQLVVMHELSKDDLIARDASEGVR